MIGVRHIVVHAFSPFSGVTEFTVSVRVAHRSTDMPSVLYDVISTVTEFMVSVRQGPTPAVLYDAISRVTEFMVSVRHKTDISP